MSEDKQYKISTGVVEGKPVKTILTLDEKPLFIVSDSFSEDQIDEVFKLCDQYFKRGVQVGIAQIQGDLQKTLGLAVKPADQKEAE